MAKDIEEHTKKRKTVMIEALREHKGLVLYASRACGVGRTTHYSWLKNDADYAKAVDELQDYVLDEVENAAFDLITVEKNPAMTIFYLKTKGKKRGFIERQEIEHSTGDLTSLRDTIRDCGIDAYEKDY